MKTQLSRVRQRGVALAMVVWFIAAMALVVAGVVMSSRADTRLAQLHLGRAQATAAADGAIALLLADAVEGQFQGDGFATPPQGRYRVGAFDVDVQAINEEVLVDINSATGSLLLETFRAANVKGSTDPGALADAVVQWRGLSADGKRRRFATVEDLIAVPGFDRAALDAVRDFVAVPVVGRGLFQSGPRAQRSLAYLRNQSPRTRGQGATGGDGPAVATSRGSALRVDALVTVGDRLWLRRRWVGLGGASAGIPWQIRRTEPARIVPRAAQATGIPRA